MRYLSVLCVVAVTACGAGAADDGDTEETTTSGGAGGSKAVGGGGTVTRDAAAGGSSAGGAKATGGGGGKATGGSVNDASAGGATGTGGGVFQTDGAPPTLVPGVWTNITPPNLDMSAAGSGVFCVAIDPSNSAVIYVCVENLGIWKTVDGGGTWAPLSAIKDPTAYDHETPFIDLAIQIAIDPNDPTHMYATEGVRGANNGFWITHDGGKTWSLDNFAQYQPTYDFTTMVVDPTDFNHVLIGSHSCCTGYIMETRDGGDTWNVIGNLPQGTFGLAFLYHPASGTGNADTWMLHGPGILRTSDAGKTWTKVADYGGIHGATESYYTKDGVLYSGAAGNPIRSTDNGLTWTQLDAGGGGVFPGVIGDGNLLYTFPDNFNPSTCKVSAESDGTVWKSYSTDTVPRGPLAMRFDPVQRIIYSANWDKGIWALKVKDP